MSDQYPHLFPTFKYLLRMWSIFQFFCQILSGPMLVMVAIAPKPAIGQIIDEPFISNPNLWLILSVAERKL